MVMLSIFNFLKFLRFLPFLKNFSTIPAIALIAFLSGSAVAAYTSHVFHKAELSDRLSDALIDQREAVIQIARDSEKLRALDQKYFEEEIQKIRLIKDKVKIITKEIIKYVPEEGTGACNYSIGAVGLLNTARQPFNAEVVSLSETTDQPNSILKTTSTHSQRAEVESHIQCAEQYNELAAQHDALIGWINNNK